MCRGLAGGNFGQESQRRPTTVGAGQKDKKSDRLSKDLLDLGPFVLLSKASNLSVTMKTRNSLPVLLAAGMAALFAVPEQATAQEVQHRIRNASIEYSMQQTPQFSVSGPRDKRSGRPMQWLEIEVELQLETLHPSEFVERLEAEFFVAVTDGETNRPVLLTERLIFEDVNAGERRTHLVAYVSPATLARITGKNRPGANDITEAAVIVTGPGLQEPAEASTGGRGRWWELDTLERRTGLVLGKSQTPFAHLWTDRYPRDVRR